MRRLTTFFLVIPLVGAVAAPVAAEAPTTLVRTDILPDVALTVEEVEPGVLRVLEDGVRDLTLDRGAWPVTGEAGGLWLFDEQGFFRLGTDGSYDWPTDLPRRQVGHGGMPLGFDVAPDGTIWMLHQQVGKKNKRTVRIRSFDGEAWTLRKRAKDTNAAECAHPTRAFAISGDGEVWASWTDPDADTKKETKATVVARLGADGWEALHQTIETSGGALPLFVTGEGEVWAAPLDGPVYRYADGAWETMTPEGVRRGCTVDIGRDGTVWFMGYRAGMVAGCPKDDACLMRYDGTDWQGWPDAPGWVASHVAPDASLWIIREPYGRGLARFDGSEWRYPFGDRLIVRASPILHAFDIADDGTVWFVASDTDAQDKKNRHPHLYVITPEAVAAAE